MRIDPTGTDFWDWVKGIGSVLSIGAGVALCFVPGAQFFGAALIAFGTVSLAGGIVGAATGNGFGTGWNVGATIGAVVAAGILTAGLIYEFAPAIAGFLGSSFSFGIPTIMSGGAAAMTMVTVTGAQVLTTVGAIAIGAGIMFMGKNDPRGHHTNPRSWTNKDMGIDALNKNNGNAKKAAKDILDDIFGKGNWNEGAGSDYNAVKKWLEDLWKYLTGGK